MSDLIAVLARQSAWQRARAKMSWTEKLRLAVNLRAVALSMRRPSPPNEPVRAVAESRASYGGKGQ